MNLCEQLGILKTTYIIKNIIEVLLVIVPLILIVMAMIDLFKLAVGNTDNYNNTIKTVSRRFIAAVVVFLVPSIIISLLSNISNYSLDAKKIICWSEANSDNIEAMELALAAEKEKAREEYERKKQENAQQELVIPEKDVINNNYTSDSPIPASTRLTPYVNGTQRALKTGDCMSWSDKCACPTIGKFNGFYFIMESSTGRMMSSVKRTGSESMTQVKVRCSDGSYITKTVNSKTKANFQNAFEKICQLKTTGISGIKISSDYLHIDGTLVERTTSSRKICSYHAYGAAIDINYDLTIKVNGKNYKPYASQGTSTRKAYDSFVSALGKEADPRNVNYILWVYAFYPSGFSWGGNWSDGSFDPMHYEIEA